MIDAEKQMAQNAKRVNADTLLIPLSKGYFAIIDAEDFASVSKYKWHILCEESKYARANIKVDGKYQKTLLHRFINRTPKEMEVDHINGNTLDNRKCNLRNCYRTQNSWNKGIRKNNSCGYKGVYWKKDAKKYATAIAVEGKRIFLGTYHTAIEASLVYKAACKKYHGEFANI